MAKLADPRVELKESLVELALAVYDLLPPAEQVRVARKVGRLSKLALQRVEHRPHRGDDLARGKRR